MASLQFKTEFQNEYFRTRQNNLRCFPHCDIVHYERTFCGQAVEFVAKGNDLKGLRAFGFFRNANSSLAAPTNLADPETAFPAKVIRADQDETHFIIHPLKRRWPCLHVEERDAVVFTVVLLRENDIVAHVDSRHITLKKSEGRAVLSKDGSFSSIHNHETASDSGASHVSQQSSSRGKKQPTAQEAKTFQRVTPPPPLTTTLQAPAAPSVVLPPFKPMDWLPLYQQALKSSPQYSPASGPPPQAAVSTISPMAGAAGLKRMRTMEPASFDSNHGSMGGFPQVVPLQPQQNVFLPNLGAMAPVQQPQPIFIQHPSYQAPHRSTHLFL